MTRISILLVLAAAGAQAQTPPIGRLFTTPEERHQLDVARGILPAPPAPPPAAAAPPPPAPVTVDGFVRRSGGKSTVWLNQDAQYGGQHGAKDARVTVTLPSGQRLRVKPGQSVDMNTGTVKDVDAP